jgi:hypothetical protein
MAGQKKHHATLTATGAPFLNIRHCRALNAPSMSSLGQHALKMGSRTCGARLSARESTISLSIF